MLLRPLYTRSNLSRIPIHKLPIHQTLKTTQMRCIGSFLAYRKRTSDSNDNLLGIDDDRISEKLMMRRLLSHVWPKNDPNTKRRVVLAMGLLVGGKILNVQV